MAGPEWGEGGGRLGSTGGRHGSGLEADCEHELLRSLPDEVVRLVIARCASIQASIQYEVPAICSQPLGIAGVDEQDVTASLARARAKRSYTCCCTCAEESQNSF